MQLVLLGLGLVWVLSRGNVLGSVTTPQLPGAAGVVQTLGNMRAMVNGAIADPLIRRYAVQATDHTGRHEAHQQALAIGEWVRRHVKYVPDPLGNEHLTNPALLLKAHHEGRRVYGDCDDMAMVCAAMAKAIGLPVSFHAVGRGKRYHHVYAEVAGVPIDPTVSFGVQPFKPRAHFNLKV